MSDNAGGEDVRGGIGREGRREGRQAVLRGLRGCPGGRPRRLPRVTALAAAAERRCSHVGVTETALAGRPAVAALTTALERCGREFIFPIHYFHRFVITKQRTVLETPYHPSRRRVCGGTTTW